MDKKCCHLERKVGCWKYTSVNLKLFYFTLQKNQKGDSLQLNKSSQELTRFFLAYKFGPFSQDIG